MQIIIMLLRFKRMMNIRKYWKALTKMGMFRKKKNLSKLNLLQMKMENKYNNSNYSNNN